MKRSYKALVMLGIGAIVAAAVFAAAGTAGSEKSSLNLIAGPVPFIEEGGSGFAIAKLLNAGPSTVTQGDLQIEFKPGVASATPDTYTPACTVSNSAAVTLVSCPLEQITAGSRVGRVVRWTAPQVNEQTPITIT